MEITENWRTEFASAERSGAAMDWMIKAVNVMRALRLPGPYTGEQVRDILAEAEKRNIKVPTTPMNELSEAEARSFRDACTTQKQYMKLPTAQPKNSKEPTMSVDDELRLKCKLQREVFEYELSRDGDSWEALEARLEEQRDPLMKVVNARNPRRK